MNPSKSIESVAARVLLSVLLMPAVAHAAVIKVIEYAGDHLFLTADNAEIAALDGGRAPGWTRTGIELWVHDAPGPGLVPVCRFYSTRFAPRSQHFFTAFEAECDAVKANPDWVWEGVAFYVQMPDASGACPSGGQAILRWYNGGRGGIPAHKFTPFGNPPTGSPSFWAIPPGGLLQAGWIREGLGASGTAFCTHGVGSSALDSAMAEAGQLELVRASSWEFRAGPNQLAIVDVAVELDAPSLYARRQFQVTATSGMRGTASWNESSGNLEIWLRNQSGSTNQLIAFSFVGASRVEGCHHHEDLDGGPVGGGPYWKACQPFVGRRL